MSYDRDAKKRRMRSAQRKRNPHAKSLGNREFRQRIADEEKKLNRRLRETEIIRMYCEELEERDERETEGDAAEGMDVLQGEVGPHSK